MSREPVFSHTSRRWQDARLQLNHAVVEWYEVEANTELFSIWNAELFWSQLVCKRTLPGPLQDRPVSLPVCLCLCMSEHCACVWEDCVSVCVPVRGSVCLRVWECKRTDVPWLCNTWYSDHASKGTLTHLSFHCCCQRSRMTQPRQHQHQHFPPPLPGPTSALPHPPLAGCQLPLPLPQYSRLQTWPSLPVNQQRHPQRRSPLLPGRMAWPPQPLPRLLLLPLPSARLKLK